MSKDFLYMGAVMKIIEATDRIPNLIDRLLEVWESSVRATHLFLSDGEIKSIKEYVPQALKGIAHLMIAEDDAGRPVAFMGAWGCTLEMLFISPEERGKGLGKRLIQYGIESYGVKRLAVNEQNPQAKGFLMNTWAFRLQKDGFMMNRGTPIPLFIHEPCTEALGELEQWKEPDEYTGIRNRAFDFEKIHGTGYGGAVSYPSGWGSQQIFALVS